MADALLAAVLTQLTCFIDQKVRKEFGQVLGSKKEVEKLRSTFEAIRAVIEDAERRQVKEHAVKLWLDKLKDISHEIEDLLDERCTAIIKSHILESPKGGFKMVSYYILSSRHSFTRTLLHRQTAARIRELTERLDVVASEKDKYNFNLSCRNEKDDFDHQRQRTTSFIDVSEVRGREQATRTAISMLLRGSSRRERYRTISIVGTGGIGKTTLAQLLYHNDEVKNHFRERIWVHVSYSCDEISIARAIVEALDQGVTTNLVELESLLHKISQRLEGIRFLLVLDDVWNEDYRIWEQLRRSLICGAMGSRILVTTRKQTVVNMFGGDDRILLGNLPEQDCWSIFSQAAFLGKNDEEYEKFRDIGRQIASKCNGLPLLAKHLGSLLRLKGSRQDWQNVLDSEIWQLEGVERGLFPPFMFSYYNLPSAIRRCFSYCSIFPRSYKFEKDRLIKMWMSQGFLDSGTTTIDMEIMGLQYFENLALHSFFQEFEKDEHDGSITKCSMHGLVHDFVRYLMKYRSLIVRDYGAQYLEISSDFRYAHHLTLIFESADAPFPVSIYKLENLRTLLIVDGAILGPSKAPPGLFVHLKRLRTLDMSGWSIDCLPKEIGKCIHLRYLNLSLNDQLKELAEEICDLCNLQTLDLHLCPSLQSLPQGIERLIKLRRLDIDGAHKLSMLPKGIGKLIALRTLSNFIVGDAGACLASKLGDLKSLDHLRGSLSIEKLGNITNVSESEKAELRNKRHLSELKLDFSGETEGRMDDSVLEALQPPIMVEILVIRKYTGTLFPSWLMLLAKLRKLELHHWTECQCLPSLGKLPSLEWLDIGGMSGLRDVGSEILGIESSGSSCGQMKPTISFPKLKKLRFWNMSGWEEWGGITDAKDVLVMPCASSLQLINCPNLKAFPNYLQKIPLRELSITTCPTLEGRCRGEDRAKISHIPVIEIDNLPLSYSH